MTNMMNNRFKKSFSVIYNVKIKCPSCKKNINAHAKKCPYCHIDLTSTDYVNFTKWQHSANFILLIIIVLIILLMIFNSVNFFMSIVIGIIIYGFGYFLINKIQSFLNYLK